MTHQACMQLPVPTHHLPEAAAVPGKDSCQQDHRLLLQASVHQLAACIIITHSDINKCITSTRSNSACPGGVRFKIPVCKDKMRATFVLQA